MTDASAVVPAVAPVLDSLNNLNVDPDTPITDVELTAAFENALRDTKYYTTDVDHLRCTPFSFTHMTHLPEHL